MHTSAHFPANVLIAIQAHSRRSEIEEIVGLLHQHARRMIWRGEIALLARCIADIPENVIEKDPKLLMFWGISHAQEQARKAEQRLRNAVELFRAQKNLDGAGEAQLYLAYILFVQESSNVRIIDLINEVDLSNLSAHLHPLYYHYRMMGLNEIDQWTDALQAGQEAIRRYRDLGNLEALSRVYRHCIYPLYYLGDFLKALKYLSEALTLAHEFEITESALTWTEYEFGRTYNFLGEFEKALERLDRAKRHLDAEPQVLIKQFIYRERGDSYSAIYDFKTADECYRISGIEEESNLYLEHINRRPGREAEAYTLLRRLVVSNKETQSGVEAACDDALEGITLLGFGRQLDGEVSLRRARSTFERLGCKYHLASIDMRLAYARLFVNDGVECRSLLAEALSIAAASGYYHLRWWQPKIHSILLAIALEYGVETEFAEAMSVRRITPEYAQPIYSLISHPSEATRQRAVRIASSLGGSQMENAYLVLASCKDELIRIRLRRWLDDGWFTPVGLLTLHHVLNGWRRLEIFLLWIYFDGRREAILNELTAGGEYIALATVTATIKQISQKLEDANFESAAYSAHAAYELAILRNFIKPTSPPRLSLR